MMRSIIILFANLFIFESIVLASPIVSPESNKERTVTIAIYDDFPSYFWPKVLGPTLEYLRSSLPELSIRTKEVTLDKEVSLRTTGADLFLVPPLYFWTEVLENGASAVAMLKSPHAANPSQSTAGVLVTRANREDLASERDLRGKKIAVQAKGSNHEFLLLKDHLKRQGIELEKEALEILEVGFRSPGVISAVTSGAVDFGLLSYCEIENAIRSGILGPEELKIISNNGSGSCSRTTALFPNIVFASYPGVNPEKAGKIAAALYEMPAFNNGYLWSYASGFDSLDGVAKNLALRPYSYLQEWRPQALWKRFRLEILLFLSLVLAVIWHIFRVNRLVAKRTKELRTALIEKEELSKKERESREQLSMLERAGLISHISSLIAHELKQPLGAISNYSAGLKAYLKSNKTDPKLVSEVLDKIIRQSNEASSVIDYVRGFSKKGSRPDAKFVCDPVAVARTAINTFECGGRFKGQLSAELASQSSCRIEAKGLELALYNLLKNAAEACQNISKPQIHLSVSDETSYVVFRIIDNGPELSEESFKRLTHSTGTSKANGLGLGIRIVRDIVENAGGRLIYDRNENGGVCATMKVPRSKNEEVKNSTRSNS